MIHPWNEPLFRQLTADRERMPHALLLHGPAGVGKFDLALALGQWILCEQPGAAGACGQCDACNWFEQGNHPDFRRVEPLEAETEAGETAAKPAKKPRQIINVDAVRAVTDFLGLTAHRGGWRCAVIHPAEWMNGAAANALLKTLEEPPPKVLLILVSHQPGRMLPTVLSRCRKVPVGLPKPEAALAWLGRQGLVGPETLLAEAGGAPLAALAYGDPVRGEQRDTFLDRLARPAELDACALAQAYQPLLAEAWGWLTRWVHDVAAQHLAGTARYFPGRTAATARLGQQVDPAALLAFQRELSDAARWLRHPLNSQLLLESWLIRYSQITGGRP